MNEFVLGLELSVRASLLLFKANIDDKEKLFELSQIEMLSWPNCGRVTVNEILDKIESLKARQVKRKSSARITFWDNLILRGMVSKSGSIFAGPSYQRKNALRLTFEFKEALTDEIIRLAYAYGKNGDSWVRAVTAGDIK